MSEAEHHWGEWVRSRANEVGLHSPAALAGAVGCSARQVDRWLKMSVAPESMRMGYDEFLAIALQVHPQALFSDYKTTPPNQVVTVIHGDGIPDTESGRIKEDEVRREIQAAADMLSGPYLTMLRDQARQVVRKWSSRESVATRRARSPHPPPGTGQLSSVSYIEKLEGDSPSEKP
ncbi:MAG: hypothetical protein AAF333_13240 [Planctomycetota bacterium]